MLEIMSNEAESSAMIIVIGVRADEEVYEIAQKRANKYNLFD